ncbi:MAG: hypothetical protein HY788_21320 [Deltaproteobacteria bacterium]|nr:hypothetical protein [Deltaproteobacteria bacterium]
MANLDKKNTAYDDAQENERRFRAFFNSDVDTIERHARSLSGSIQESGILEIATAGSAYGQSPSLDIASAWSVYEDYAQSANLGVCQTPATHYASWTTTSEVLPLIKERIEQTVLAVRHLAIKFEGRDQLTNFNSNLMIHDVFKCLEGVHTEGEIIAIARIGDFEATADRLCEFISDKEPVNLLSVKQLLRFLSGHRELREPAITLTNDGNVKAIWQKSNSEIFWIQFSESDDVRYLAFVPNKERSDGIERTAGWSTLSSVCNRAIELRAIEWMTDDSSDDSR